MKQLVFVHGRAQERKDAAALKVEWIDAWRKGLAENDLQMPLAESDIRFPYYGDTLFDLTAGMSPEQAAHIVIKGAFDPEMDEDERRFVYDVLITVQRERGISPLDIADATGRHTEHRGFLNWGWVQDLLETIDRRVPFASGASVALATRDVYRYLVKDEVRNTIDTGVRAAITPGVPTVVVSHSLGTVVAYNLLRNEGLASGWKVPLFVTLGSPLGVEAMRAKLAPHRHPECAGRWFNAYDPRDVVALFPLDEEHFPVDPSIVNKGDVDNLTSNRHGISGYLSDPEVAKTIYTALIG